MAKAAAATESTTPPTDPATTPPAETAPPSIETADVNKLSAKELAAMREANEKRGAADAASPHAICPDTGLKYVKKTGLVPVRFNSTIEGIANKGEIKGRDPKEAQFLINKGTASKVLD